MYRRVVLSNKEWIATAIDVLYRVRGATPLTQYRRATTVYDENYPTGSLASPAVFNDAVRLRATSGTGAGSGHPFEIVLDVSENQPEAESIEEITNTGSSAVVLNENGVVVCRNTPKTPSSSAPEQAGETTSEPIVAPGDITSELIDNSVETSEPIDGTGETTSEPI